MTLTTPLALLGLLTLPLIAALHILRARSDRRVVSSLSLWRFLDPQVRGAKARRIPLTWLLLADLLIAALLTLALAGPQLDLPRQTQPARHVILLLDTSASMGTTDGDSTRFEQAAADAEALLLSLAPQDVATLITFGVPTRTLADSRSVNLQLLITQLRDVSPASPAADLPSALALAQAAHDPALPAEIHLYSDDPRPIPDSQFPVAYHTYGSPANNQSILSLAATPLSDGKYQVFARFANFGDTAVTRNAAIFVDGEPAPGTSTPITLDANTSIGQTWTIIAAPRFIMVALDGTDALPADDFASLGINAPAALHLALVTAEPGAPWRALTAIPGTDVQIIAPENYLPGSRFDLVVFDNFLPADKPTSPVLILNPPTDPEDLPLTSFSVLKLDELLIGSHPLTKELDFAGIRNVRLITPAQIAAPNWITSTLSSPPLIQVGSLPLLSHAQIGGTQATIFYPALAAGNLTRHPVFLFLISNILEFYRSLDIPDQIKTGEPLWIPTTGSLSLLTPEGARHDLAACPCEWADTHAAGVYRLDVTSPDGAAQTYWVGANTGSLTESDLAVGQGSGSGEQAAGGTAELEQPVPLAPYLLGLVVLLLLWEAWIAWK